MRHGKLIAGAVLGLIVVFVIASLTAYRFVKRAFGDVYSASQPARTASSNGTPSIKNATSAQIVSPPFALRGEAMAQAFRSGKLPAPLPQPTGTPEEAAAELAKRVVAEDEQCGKGDTRGRPNRRGAGMHERERQSDLSSYEIDREQSSDYRDCTAILPHAYVPRRTRMRTLCPPRGPLLT